MTRGRLRVSRLPMEHVLYLVALRRSASIGTLRVLTTGFREGSAGTSLRLACRSPSSYRVLHPPKSKMLASSRMLIRSQIRQPLCGSASSKSVVSLSAPALQAPHSRSFFHLHAPKTASQSLASQKQQGKSFSSAATALSPAPSAPVHAQHVEYEPSATGLQQWAKWLPKGGLRGVAG